MKIVMDDLPPVVTTVEEELARHISNPERLPIHVYERSIRFWERTPQPKRLLQTELSPLSTTLAVDRDPVSGMILA